MTELAPHLVKRILLALAALGDRFLATAVDRHVCEWANLTNGDD